MHVEDNHDNTPEEIQADIYSIVSNNASAKEYGKSLYHSSKNAQRILKK